MYVGYINGGQTMALIIVAMVMVAGIFRARIRYAHKYGGREAESESRAARAEAERLREEVKQLKERLQVLERITVEKESSLEREFARLRDQ
jgi:transposase-like protein